MESFFITIYPKEIQCEKLNGMRMFSGESNALNMDYKNLFSNTFTIKPKEDYIVVDKCIEFIECSTNQNGKYIVLIGCFSCYDIGCEVMQSFANIILENVESELFVDICGQKHLLAEVDLMHHIKIEYQDKYDDFMTWNDKKITICSSSEYYKKLSIKMMRAKRFLKRKFLEKFG